jgi:hypothetical protein
MERTITLTDKEITDICKGLVIAMKELDRYENGSDRILADRLEIIVKNIEKQAQ